MVVIQCRDDQIFEPSEVDEEVKLTQNRMSMGFVTPYGGMEGYKRVILDHLN